MLNILGNVAVIDFPHLRQNWFCKVTELEIVKRLSGQAPSSKGTLQDLRDVLQASERMTRRLVEDSR